MKRNLSKRNEIYRYENEPIERKQKQNETKPTETNWNKIEENQIKVKTICTYFDSKYIL